MAVIEIHEPAICQCCGEDAGMLMRVEFNDIMLSNLCMRCCTMAKKFERIVNKAARGEGQEVFEEEVECPF